MCTVVFIPDKEKYYFASLRDENPNRLEAIVPFLTNTNNCNFLAPRDPKGGGTWAGINEYGNVIILLNGGFKNHTKQNNYSKSRGIIVTELLLTKTPVAEWTLFDLDNIEPFTLIVWAEEKLSQLVWDGKSKTLINLSSKEPHIWSSATLYSDNTKNYRTKLFKKWMTTEPYLSKFSLLNFFKTYNENYNGFLMKRGENIKTLSYTFIEIKTTNTATVSYYDFNTVLYTNSTIAFLKKALNFL